LLAEANGLEVSTDVRTHIGKLLRMQACVAGTDGHIPDLGDRSDDTLFPLNLAAGKSGAALREIYRVLFAPRMLPLARDHPALDGAFWLLGGTLCPAPEQPEEIGFVEFPQTGLALFLDDMESTRCAFRTGPAESVKVLPGHMHADLMSVTLVCRGAPILVDAGTYSYRFVADGGTTARVNWRDYFAGPRAHNGLVVGSRSPLGPLTGDFRDSATLPSTKHVASKANEGLAFLEGRMEGANGYPALARGVIHIRGVGFIVYNIVDDLPADEETRFAFQLAPRCVVAAISATQLRLENAGVGVGFAWSDDVRLAESPAGREFPTNGWVSTRYGERTAATQLLFDARGAKGLSAFTLLLQDSQQVSSVECQQPSAEVRSFRIQSPSLSDHVVLNLGALESAVTAWDVTFRGRLAWIRIPASGSPVIRWIDGISCDVPSHGLQHRFDTVQARLPR